MSDASVRAALRSDERLVVIEAPAGCGKTHQGADYAGEVARVADGRLLILTHTHAACSVFAERTRSTGTRVEIRTIDSLISQVAGAYHTGLDLPPDPTAWARRAKDGYSHLAVKVSSFLDRHPMVAAALARRYPFVICDEHQDCSGDQHAIGMALHREGARLRVFADPMQRIYKDKVIPGGKAAADWLGFTRSAGAHEELDTPHRWNDGCPELGAWTLEARRVLKAGGQIDLRSGLPRSVEVVRADNQARRYGDYQLTSVDRRAIDAFERGEDSLLIVSHFSDTAQNLRAFFNRRLPLWEGHTRPALEGLVDATITHNGKPADLAQALVVFIGEVGKGFSPSAFGNRFVQEAVEGCARPTTGKKPSAIQAMARHIVDEPDHRGVASALRSLADFRKTHSDFSGIALDGPAEFWEAVRLGGYADPEEGFAEITHHRTHSPPCQ